MKEQYWTICLYNFSNSDPRMFGYFKTVQMCTIKPSLTVLVLECDFRRSYWWYATWKTLEEKRYCHQLKEVISYRSFVCQAQTCIKELLTAGNTVERMTSRVSEWVDGCVCMSECVGEWGSKSVNEWVSAWVSEGASQWMNGWVRGWVRE